MPIANHSRDSCCAKSRPQSQIVIVKKTPKSPQHSADRRDRECQAIQPTCIQCGCRRLTSSNTSRVTCSTVVVGGCQQRSGDQSGDVRAKVLLLYSWCESCCVSCLDSSSHRPLHLAAAAVVSPHHDLRRCGFCEQFSHIVWAFQPEINFMHL